MNHLLKRALLALALIACAQTVKAQTAYPPSSGADSAGISHLTNYEALWGRDSVTGNWCVIGGTTTCLLPEGGGTGGGAVYGPSAIGAAPSQPPVYIGGIDTLGHLQGFLTDTSGREWVNIFSLPSIAITNTSFGISGTLPAFASTPTFNCGTGCYQTTQPVSNAGTFAVQNTAATPSGANSIGSVGLNAGTNIVGAVTGFVGYSDTSTNLANNATFSGAARTAPGWASYFRGRAWSNLAGTLSVLETISGIAGLTVASTACTASTVCNVSVNVEGGGVYAVSFTNTGGSTTTTLAVESGFTAN